MSSSWKKDRDSPSNSAPANAPASQPQAIDWQQLLFPTKSQSQSNSQSPEEKQQSQAVYQCQWSALTPLPGPSPSPFPRYNYIVSTSVTSAGELFLFGGVKLDALHPSTDLYAISTRDFSRTLFKTRGDVPKRDYVDPSRTVLTGTFFLIWGNDSLYLLNLASESREWARVVVNGPRIDSRHGNTMTLVGPKLIVIGGCNSSPSSRMKHLNDIWALDLNNVKSGPFWESYEPAPGNEKPLPRSSHVSVTTGDRVIIFGGYDNTQSFNDTWSFDISTRKWTELQCTGSIPSPRVYHAAVLLGDVMYVFGGKSQNGDILDDLTALNLSTQRWIAFQSIGRSPSARYHHAMAYDGARVFVFGGILSPDAESFENLRIYVLDTKHLDYPGRDSDVIDSSEKTTKYVQKSSASPPTRGQPVQLSSPSSDTRAAHGFSPFQKDIQEGPDHRTSQLITSRKNPILNGLASRPTGASGRPRRVPEEDDDSEGSTEHYATLVASDAPSGKQITGLEDGRLIELGRQLSETLVAKAESDRRIGQLTGELGRAEANVAEEKKRARLDLRELQVKLDESLMSRDRALQQAEGNAAEEGKRARLELRELQTKLDESLLSRDHALAQAQSALQKASCVAEANEQSQRELTEMRAELEARRSELSALRLRLVDTENGCAKCKAEANTYSNQNETGFVNTDEDRVVHELLERIRTLEAEVASLRWNEKSFEMMECRNED